MVLKSDDFIGNNWRRGQVRQTNRSVVCISVSDLNGDGLDDIILITACKNDVGQFSGIPYQVADVYFQSESGFYRDYRISDKLNRFDMNQDYFQITDFVRDGISREFLFTAKTLVVRP